MCQTPWLPARDVSKWRRYLVLPLVLAYLLSHPAILQDTRAGYTNVLTRTKACLTLSVCLAVCTYLSSYLPVCSHLFACLFSCLSVLMPVCLHTCLPVCLPNPISMRARTDGLTSHLDNSTNVKFVLLVFFFFTVLCCSLRFDCNLQTSSNLIYLRCHEDLIES